MKPKMKWMEHVVGVGEGSCEYRVLVRKYEEGKPLGRSNSSWKDNIKIDRQEVRWSHGLD
jgi:hypothetical protein